MLVYTMRRRCIGSFIIVRITGDEEPLARVRARIEGVLDLEGRSALIAALVRWVGVARFVRVAANRVEG